MAVRKAGWPAQDWDRIERVFESLSNESDAPAPNNYHTKMKMLVARMRLCGLAEILRAHTAHDALRLSMTEPVSAGGGTILIERVEDGTKARLTFEEHVWPNSKMGRTNWNHDYEPRQLPEALARCLVRAGWFADGHPVIARFLGQASE